MPKVTVRFFAWIREELGLGSVSVDATDIDDLFDKLKKMLKNKFVVIERNSIFLSVNNEIIKNRKRKFRDGDIVDIMPLGSGG